MNSDAVNCRPEQVFRLVVTGGGTGGHTYSALTAVRTLQARLADAGRALDVLWVGSAGGPDVPSPAAIAELTALGKAAVFVPPASSAGNEQAHNARHLQEAGAAVALLGEVTPQGLREAVAPLLADPRRREHMAERARVHGRPDAADRLVDVLLDAATAN